MKLSEIDIINFADTECRLPFKWGVRDCNALAVRFLDLITGCDFSTQIVKKYRTMTGAVRFQKKFKKRAEDILKEAGAQPVNPGFERTGDFLVVDSDKWQMVHIYMHGKVLSADPKLGVVMIPLSMIARPYKVLRIT